MFLSKRSDIHLPENWPSYFSKSKDIYIWDLDGNKYVDFSQMGVGTNILGYTNKKIDNAVKKIIDKGNMSTLNPPEEVALSQKLLSIHPWFDMVKFCRTGGEANALAVRIARAYTKRDNIAFCGYHGWHDWYLSSNLNNKQNLDQHLISNLKTSGVPKKLLNTAFPFAYNDYEKLNYLVKNKNIGIVKMEVIRNEKPKNNFLKKVRKLCDDNNIVLIFDECTTGFRENYGGLHIKFKVFPDMAIFGKAIGNGYAITSILGKKNIMKYSESSFVSSTFWSERIGYVASLKTLEVMKNEKSWIKIKSVGEKIRKGWLKISKETNVQIKISGLSSLCNFYFDNKHNLILKTFMTQEMLKKGFLASTSFYPSTKHNDKDINKYLKELKYVFSFISKFNNDYSKLKSYLDGPVCIDGIKRLN